VNLLQPFFATLFPKKATHMAQNIRFRGYLTFDDSLKVQQALKTRRLVPPVAIVTVLTLGAVALAFWQMKVEKSMAIFMLVFLAAFMGGGFWLMNASARKSQKKLYEKACIKRHGTLKEDGIQIKKGHNRHHISWELFDKTIEIDGILAVVKKTESLGFARYMFSSENEWSRARDLIKSRYPQG
jgi:hypothetical protein